MLKWFNDLSSFRADSNRQRIHQLYLKRFWLNKVILISNCSTCAVFILPRTLLHTFYLKIRLKVLVTHDHVRWLDNTVIQEEVPVSRQKKKCWCIPCYCETIPLVVAAAFVSRLLTEITEPWNQFKRLLVPLPRKALFSAQGRLI